MYSIINNAINRYERRQTSMKLKQYLDERKTNKIWLAEQLGISVQALYVKLRGEGAFSLEQAFKIKDVLRMTDEEFNEVFGG